MENSRARHGSEDRQHTSRADADRGSRVTPALDGVDLTASGSSGCPHCGGVPLHEEKAGYYGCPECLGLWAGDPGVTVLREPAFQERSIAINHAVYRSPVSP